jgi:glutamate-ammonia-ligase adenylyltransferase
MTSINSGNAIDTLCEIPEVLKEPAARWFERQAREYPGEPCTALGDANQAILARMIACSEFAGSILIRDWAWFLQEIHQSRLARPPNRRELDEMIRALMQDSLPDGKGLRRNLRMFRNRQMLGILWREFAGLSNVPGTLAALSALADALIEFATITAGNILESRFGRVHDAEGRPIPLIVMAMGKLGGQELNFSSDVDLVFLYPTEGESGGERKVDANEYFTRWARLLVSLLDEVTEDGFVYRVDTRLRPFGESGPLVVSFAAFESYLLQHGRSWERYAYLKARIIGDSSQLQVDTELMKELVNPFVYRRYLDYGVFESLREMKALIAAEVSRRELSANIKLGPGGIREIEFIVQSLQLVRGGSDPTLQGQSLLPVLPLLARGAGLSLDSASKLSDAYIFMRRLENFIQGIRDSQTHDLPQSAADQARLALAMGFAGWADLDSTLQKHRAEISRQFSDVVFRSDKDEERSELSRRVASLWNSAESYEDWIAELQKLGVTDAAGVASKVISFAKLPAVQQLDTVSRRRLTDFVPVVLAQLHKIEHPAVVLDRIFKIVEQILRRSAYLALLNENPAVMERLVRLCEGSAYLASEIARFPVLLDEMLDSRRFTEDLNASEMNAEIERRLSAYERQDSERRVETLAQFQRATLFRIAVADFSESLPIMKVSDRLTELAELVLHVALETAWNDLRSRHGEPWFDDDDGKRKAGFGVIAYGKLGGIELSYGSDLDLVFLHDSRGRVQQTDGERPLENSMFFTRLVRRLVHFLTTQTASGVLYDVDTRLRPDGRSGLLVTSVEAFERYQKANAWTWEHQALLRSRPVAGSAAVARDFERIRSATLRQRIKREQLLDDVLNMRDKMRKQLDKSSPQAFDLKQGVGGIADIEFLVQYLVLRNAADHPAVIHYSDNIRQLGTLSAANCLDEAVARRLQQIYKKFRLRLHRLALDGRPPIVDDSEFVQERNEVRSIWDREMVGPESSTLL